MGNGAKLLINRLVKEDDGNKGQYGRQFGNKKLLEEPSPVRAVLKLKLIKYRIYEAHPQFSSFYLPNCCPDGTIMSINIVIRKDYFHSIIRKS